MSPPLEKLANPRVRFPRVSGDEPQTMISSGTLTVFSPRERG